MKLRIQPMDGWANRYEIFVDGKQVRNAIVGVKLEMDARDKTLPSATLLLSGPVEQVEGDFDVNFQLHSDLDKDLQATQQLLADGMSAHDEPGVVQRQGELFEVSLSVWGMMLAAAPGVARVKQMQATVAQVIEKLPATGQIYDTTEVDELLKGMLQ